MGFCNPNAKKTPFIKIRYKVQPIDPGPSHENPNFQPDIQVYWMSTSGEDGDWKLTKNKICSPEGRVHGCCAQITSGGAVVFSLDPIEKKTGSWGVLVA